MRYIYALFVLFLFHFVIYTLFCIEESGINSSFGQDEDDFQIKTPTQPQRINRLFGTHNDIVVIPIQKGSYICEFLGNSTKMIGGCVKSCSTDGNEGNNFKCYVRTHRKSLEIRFADVVVNHFGPLRIRKYGDKPYLRVFFTGESNYTHPREATDAFLKQYDMVVSFHHHRKYYFTWANNHMPYFLEIIQNNQKSSSVSENNMLSKWQKRKSAIAVFLSDCKWSNRVKVIRMLAKYYRVHSYGRCAKNQEVPIECAALLGRYDQKMCVLQKYKYALALENSREKDYVTEKVYHALLSGAIPLYWGAPNIEEFVPLGRNSIIEVENFLPGQLGDVVLNFSSINNNNNNKSNYQRFGEYLRRLEMDEVTLKRIFAWQNVQRIEDWGKEFTDNLLHQTPICAICAEARERRNRMK